MVNGVFNETEAAERGYLEDVRNNIRAELARSGAKVGASYQDVIDLKQYLQDSKADMDHVEKLSVRQSIEQVTMVGEHHVLRNRQLKRLLGAPYFGRIDFQKETAASAQPVYVGIHSFRAADTKQQLVHDWRAPISSMFYDFEIGPAFFDAPDGRTSGALALKRQYRIENGKMVFMLETSLNIHDDVLQAELSRASSEKMRNIVATIQRDQNAIIRNDEAHTLIIQGAAGSGKTSIALHRIAYLLYKFKDSIASQDVLIISPNRVFGHYIANVLPELGEESITETTMEALADHLLQHRVHFQPFHEQVATLLKGNKAYLERLRFKSTPEFLLKIEAYARYVREHNLTPAMVDLGRHQVEADVVEQLFRKQGACPYAEQIIHVTEALVARAQSHYGVEIAGPARARVRKQLKDMLWCTDRQKLYKEFYEWMGESTMLKIGKGKVYEYADVYPLIYLGMLLEGVTPHAQVKHLVIDEMQDYSAVQYKVLDRLFSCKKTVLGDCNQSVNPFSASCAETIHTQLTPSECVYMNRSYRSTIEILQVAQHLLCNPDLVPMERHGDVPRLLVCRDAARELKALGREIDDFSASPHHSMAVICKTQEEADTLYAQLIASGVSTPIHALNTQSTLFSQGVIIATAHLVKGLEFDRVVVPHCTRTHYREEIDRHMLYVSCTRAMHRLCMTCTGAITPFLQDAPIRHDAY